MNVMALEINEIICNTEQLLGILEDYAELEAQKLHGDLDDCVFCDLSRLHERYAIIRVGKYENHIFIE